MDTCYAMPKIQKDVIEATWEYLEKWGKFFPHHYLQIIKEKQPALYMKLAQIERVYSNNPWGKQVIVPALMVYNAIDRTVAGNIPAIQTSDIFSALETVMRRNMDDWVISKRKEMSSSGNTPLLGMIDEYGETIRKLHGPTIGLTGRKKSMSCGLFMYSVLKAHLDNTVLEQWWT